MLEKEKHSNDDHCIFLFMTGWVLWQNKALGITECKPDIIAITGDFIDCRNPNVDIAMKFILGAVDIAPVYYVPGNHECWEKEAYTELCRRIENALETVSFHCGSITRRKL